MKRILLSLFLSKSTLGLLVAVFEGFDVGYFENVLYKRKTPKNNTDQARINNGTFIASSLFHKKIYDD